MNSNYKGFPICQAKTSHDELRSDSSMELKTDRRDGRVASMKAQEVRTGQTTTGHDAVVRLRTLMEDARGGLIR